MVMRAVRKFASDVRGIVLVEALLVIPIVLLFVTVMVEFSVLMYTWNQSVKAVQIAARRAAVSTPLVDRADYNAAMYADYGTIPAGDPVPAAMPSISCGPNGNACDAGRMNNLLTGGDGICGAGSTMVGACDVAPWIGANNLTVTYVRTGLGYVGRPNGPVTTVVVELNNMTLNFLLMDRFIPGLSSIAIPPHRVSITSEDLSDCDVIC